MKHTRWIALLLAASLLLCLSACARKTADSSLYDQGLQLISSMDEMARNGTYLSMMSADEQIAALLQTSYTQHNNAPNAVYQITLQRESFSEPDVAESFPGFSGLSESLQLAVLTRTSASIPTLLNSQGGAVCVAASSLCSASTTFESNECRGSLIYLYVYETSAPVAVCFTRGAGKAVSASATLLLADGLELGSEQQIQAALDGLPIIVTRVR